MNVLFLTYSYLPNLGGVERSVHNLALLMTRHGHQVTVATHDLRAIPFRYRPREAPPTLRLHVPSQTDPAPPVRAFRAVINPLNLAVLAGYCLLKKIDVVHCHHLNTDTVYARRLARLLNVGFVLTLRGGETEEWIHTPARRRYVIEQLRGAHHVTAVSRSLLAQAAALAPEIRERSTVVPNPVDPAGILAAMAAAPPAPARRAYVLFAGRLEFMKDVECLLDAYRAAVAADPRFEPELLVAGEGSLADALRRRAGAGGAAGRVRFLGRVSHAETLRLIAAAMMVVLPSRCSEGCPNVVLEAMALGTPVVVSDLPSLRELVDPGVDGSVFAVGDRDQLQARLRELASDAGLRATLAQGAQARLRTRHAGAAVADRYAEIYAQALGRAAGKSRAAAR